MSHSESCVNTECHLSEEQNCIAILAGIESGARTNFHPLRQNPTRRSLVLLPPIWRLRMLDKKKKKGFGNITSAMRGRFAAECWRLPRSSSTLHSLRNASPSADRLTRYNSHFQGLE
ncbi:hypothetical protein V6N11_012841 [Hibiscus sabdariffa]|uniref:Uncharacterized protein n=1 Tax=Hibiscus sabdariffa TaxID=183260 RepID=A0ABR1ZYP4_9ROSI